MEKKRVLDFRPYDPPSVVHEEADLMDLIRHFLQRPDLHHVCVVDRDSRLMGLVNRKLLFRNVFSHHVGAGSQVTRLFTLLTAETSGELMLLHPVSTTEEAPIDTVIETLIHRNIGEIPVVDDEGRILGFIGILRIMKEWVEEEKRKAGES